MSFADNLTQANNIHFFQNIFNNFEFLTFKLKNKFLFLKKMFAMKSQLVSI